jgi:subtilisin family serine protease
MTLGMLSRTANAKLAAATLALLLAAPVAAGLVVPDVDDATAGLVEPSRYIVAFHKDPFLKPGETYMGEPIVSVDHDLVYIIVLTRNVVTFEARAKLDDNVRYVQWDNPHYGSIDMVPNDSRYGDAGHWGSKKIGGEAAWDVTTGSTAVKVAMIDSGLNKAHEDITGSRVLQGYDFHNGDTDPNDESGCSWHGTHTTGTAGATINNGKGIAGMSQHTILPIKALGSSFFGCTGSSSGLANALKYAGDQGAHVSSNSWGGGGVDSLLNDAIQYAHDRGVIHIAAAGNSGPCTNCVSEPWKSKASIVTIVASTTESDGQSSFSSEGAEIDVSAPGSNILSTTSGTTGYGSLSGTSMATPHVAGVAALLKAVNPSWTFSQVDNRLKTTAVDLGPSGHDHDFGYGRINAAAALGGGSPPPPTYACSDGIDNDGDGLTDYPNDPGCTSTTDNDEYNAPAGCTGPANNCFSSPTSVAAGGATLTQSTSGATLETGEPRPCGSIGATVWFTWTPTTSGTATIETVGSNYDTVVAAYTGSSLGGLTNGACNDDIASGNLQSRISLSVTAGTTYRIQAGGYNGATGSLTLKVVAPGTSCGTPANNNFACSTTISARPYTNTQSTTGANLESGEPRPCGSIGGTVWYSWTPTSSGTFTVDTRGSNYDTVLAIYTGSSVGGLTNLACNDDIGGGDLDSTITRSFTAGVTYRIQVGGYNGATGSTMKLNIN